MLLEIDLFREVEIERKIKIEWFRYRGRKIDRWGRYININKYMEKEI